MSFAPESEKLVKQIKEDVHKTCCEANNCKMLRVEMGCNILWYKTLNDLLLEVCSKAREYIRSNYGI